MRFTRTTIALALMLGLPGCYPATQTEYSPAVVEQPQPVQFYYGTLVDVQNATLEYGHETGFGATVAPRFPPGAGIHVGGAGPVAAVRFSAGVADVFVEASVPHLPAIEYTVLLDYGTSPPDFNLAGGGGRGAIIVVQNEPTDHVLQKNQRVVVRVVGGSARVMANPLHPDVARQVAAGPMPVPLALPAPCDTVAQIAGAC